MAQRSSTAPHGQPRLICAAGTKNNCQVQEYVILVLALLLLAAGASYCQVQGIWPGAQRVSHTQAQSSLTPSCLGISWDSEGQLHSLSF